MFQAIPWCLVPQSEFSKLLQRQHVILTICRATPSGENLADRAGAFCSMICANGSPESQTDLWGSGSPSLFFGNATDSTASTTNPWRSYQSPDQGKTSTGKGMTATVKAAKSSFKLPWTPLNFPQLHNLPAHACRFGRPPRRCHLQDAWW